MNPDVELIKQQREVWINAINRGSADDFVAVLTEDAVWLPGGRPAIAGKESIRRWLTPPFSAYDYNYSVEDTQIHVAGEWAVERASFLTRMRSKTGDEAPEHRGTYTLLWRRESGVWLIERYIDHSGEASGRR